MREDRAFGRKLLGFMLREQRDVMAQPQPQPRPVGHLLATSLRIERDQMTERATLLDVLARMEERDAAEPKLDGYAGRVGRLVRTLPDFGETPQERRQYRRYLRGHFVCEKAVPATYYGEPAVLLDVRFGDGRGLSVYEAEVAWCEPERPAAADEGPQGGDAA